MQPSVAPSPRIECHGFTGHGVADEQTLSWLKHAGVGIIELDIQVTSDGQVIEFHNFQTPEGRWVFDTPASDLVEVGPAHGDLPGRLSRLGSAGFTVNLDLKVFPGFQANSCVIDAVTRFLAEVGPTDAGHLSAWDRDLLAQIKADHPALRTRAALKGRPYHMDSIGEGIDGVNLPWDGTTIDDVQAIKQAGVFVAFYGGWGDRYVCFARDMGADIVSVDLHNLRSDSA